VERLEKKKKVFVSRRGEGGGKKEKGSLKDR